MLFLAHFAFAGDKTVKYFQTYSLETREAAPSSCVVVVFLSIMGICVM